MKREKTFIAAGARTKFGARHSISRFALASALGLAASPVLADPAVFFNDDSAAGIQTFQNVIAAADAAYNAANPGATQQSTVFAIDLLSNTGSQFSVTSGGQTVYVVASRGGSPATTSGVGDEGSDGFNNWSVQYTQGDFNSAIAAGYTLSFYSDVSHSTPFSVNAAGLLVSDWGTCCTASNTTPGGGTAAASQIYMLFNGSTPLLVGGISTPIPGEEHFVAAIDDSNSFSSVTLVPNGYGEAFGAGGYLLFSNVQIGSVPANSSVVTVGTPPAVTPDIDDGYTIDELLDSEVNPTFDGGTLTAVADAAVSNNIIIKSTGGTIDTNGFDTVFSGTLSDASGATGNLAKTGQGTLTLTGVGSYTGTTTVQTGTLALSGNGSIAASSGLLVNATFDISDTTNGASLQALNGTGSVVLGSKRLTVTNANGAFSGTINGTGGLSITGGTLTLSGANGFSGGLLIDGAAVNAASDANLGTGTVTIGNGTLHTTGGFTASQSFAVSHANATIDTGANAVTIAGGISGPGTLNKTGSGTLTLSGPNSHAATNILGGRLVADSAAALGAANGDLTIGANSSFAAASNMTISQAVHVAGVNAVFDTGANNVTLTGGADGPQCLIKEGTGRLTLASAASNAIGACVNNGTLSFNNVFTGNVWVQQTGTASGSGVINGNVEVRGMLAPGNSPGELIVNGSVTQMPGSVFSVDVDGMTAGTGAGHFDTLVLQGANSVYTADGTITPVLRGITGSATNTFAPEIGARFQIVTAEGGVVGTYDAITQPTVGLPTNSRFDVIYNANSIILYVTPNDFGTMFAPGTMLNAAQFGGAVDRFRTSAGTENSGAIGTLLDGLYPLGQAALGRALEQASGEIHANAMDAAVTATRFARNSVSDRLNADVDGLDVDTPLSRRVWGVMSRDISHVDADTHGQGYRTNSFSMVIGADRTLGTQALVGAAFAYNRSKIGTAFAGSASADSYHGIVYGRFNASHWYVNGQLSFGQDLFNANRTVNLSTVNQHARGEGKGASLGGDLEAGYKLRFGKTLLTPALGVSYDGLGRDGFAETGDASVALRLDKDVRRSVVGRAGARLSTTIEGKGVTLLPYASAFVTHELNDQASVITPTLNGQRFRVTAAAPDRTTVRLNAGVNAVLSSDLTLQVNYRRGDGGNYDANAVSAGVSIRW